MLERRKAKRRITLGADKAYDVAGFVTELRARKVTPHIAIDGDLSKTGERRKTAPPNRSRDPAPASSHAVVRIGTLV